jgi:hypothetical protein
MDPLAKAGEQSSKEADVHYLTAATMHERAAKEFQQAANEHKQAPIST